VQFIKAFASIFLAYKNLSRKAILRLIYGLLSARMSPNFIGFLSKFLREHSYQT
jgi:hypothetical protein